MNSAVAAPGQPIVGIGASAGGIEAFKAFFENMPPDSGLGFVVMLHLPADRKSILPDLLSRWTSMPVIEVTDGCLAEANRVYVPPPGVVVTLRDHRLHLHRLAVNETRERSPISMFFDSLAVALQEDAIGVVLSGTGNDGALGLKAIKASGGLTLAQGNDGAGRQHGGMPDSAIATGAIDIIASVEDMPGRILAVLEARHTLSSTVDLTAEQTDATRLAICSVLHRQLGHDFSGYKDKTFLRRVHRRMQVLSSATLSDYLARLEDDRAEAGALFRDLLIGVTSFFRDMYTFETLKLIAFPRVFEGKGAGDTVRVWVPGCATGEEAYSLAILLREFADGIRGDIPRIQIFATDIDEPAIGTARAGRYPSTLLRDMPSERLARFFVAGSEGSYVVSKDIRDLCTFSTHSLTRDPPFSRMDLVSCRNLLIYLDSDLQSMVIPAFHYCLVPRGVLLLGSSEGVSRHESLFETLDGSNRIFQRRDGPSPPLQLTGRSNEQHTSQNAKASFAGVGAKPRPARATMGARASARVLERFGPAFVIVTAEGDVTQYSSGVGRFLEPAVGSPDQNVFAMGRRGLSGPLRTALNEAVKSNRLVESSRVTVTVPGEGPRRITLSIEPMHQQGTTTLYLVVFVEAAPQERDATNEQVATVTSEAEPDRHFEAELRDTQEQLQSITEEHETALEELRSANEELLSVNEEFQSTNEELETSKEEIQSINEELQTVNGQLAGKVDELDSKNTDLKNLFESTQVATIFLDPYLVVRSFTPAVASIYNLIPSDIGRPLSDIVSRLRYTGLRDDVRQVFTTLEPLERRVVRDDDATHYLVRILPYRTPASTVDGTIITFVDVTSMVQAEKHQMLLVDELNHRVKNMLTVVISIAHQTLRRAKTLEEFSENYMGRVHALNAAYTLLSAKAWQTVDLGDILAEELRPFLAGDRTNAVVDGPVVQLQPRAALALSMAVHELTTNAVKYGALSVPEGNVLVTWRIEDAEDGSHLTLDWIESDGPPVVAPTRRGFGTTLIERGLKQDMKATVDLDFAVGGVRARVKAPLRLEAVTDSYESLD